MSDQEQGVLKWLDSWRLAAAAAVALAVLLALWSIKLTLDTRSLAERNRALAAAVAVEQDKRHQAELAANRNQVDTCFERNAQAPGLRALLMAIRPVVAGNRSAEEAIDNYIAITGANVPRRKECVALARKLNVEVPR